MKVGYVLRYWPTLSETFVAREVAELRRRGVAVEVGALGARADADQAEPSDVPVLRPPHGAATLRALPALRHLGRTEVRWARRNLRPRDLVRTLWLADQGAARGWDRVHAHFVGEAAERARVVADLLGIPWSVTAHAVDLFVPRPSVAELLRCARPAITVCDHHVRWIAERYGVVARLVRCGVPIDVPPADPRGSGAGVDEAGAESVRLVCVARDVPKKGLDDLVAALPAGSTLRLVSDAHRLAGPRVEVGPLRASEVPAALARAHLFVLPCRVAANGDRDGLPVALLEAMAAGLPVVSTAVAGIPEVVDDEVGWLVPPDDPAALRSALSHAAEDPAARVTRGAAARRRILERGLTVEAQVDALLAAWS